MEITLLEKLQLIAQRKDLSITKIADNMGMSKQSLSAKLKRKTFTFDELEKLSAAIGCTLTVTITDSTTNEQY